MQGRLLNNRLTAFDRYRVFALSHQTGGRGRYSLFPHAHHAMPLWLVCACVHKQVTEYPKCHPKVGLWLITPYLRSMQTTEQHLPPQKTLALTLEGFYGLFKVGLGLSRDLKSQALSVTKTIVLQAVNGMQLIYPCHRKSCKCCWLHVEMFANVWDTGSVKESTSIPTAWTEWPVAPRWRCHLNPITVYFSVRAITSLVCTMSLSNLTWQVAYVKKPILAPSKFHKCARNHKLEGIS